jgi:hypothetical protein
MNCMNSPLLVFLLYSETLLVFLSFIYLQLKEMAVLCCLSEYDDRTVSYSVMMRSLIMHCGALLRLVFIETIKTNIMVVY